MTDLAKLNPTDRFTDRARDYLNYRPSYPPSVIDLILANLGEPSALRIADMGAGTGISARLLADRGANVIALEPNEAMRRAASHHDQVEYRTQRAEATGLEAGSIDIVTAFQAFHWFEPHVALAEFQRILKPTGRLALVWNNRDLSDGFTQAYGEVLQSVSDQPVKIEVMPLFQGDDRFTNLQSQTIAQTQQLSLAELTGLALSRSYTPRAGDEYELLLDRLNDLYEWFVDAEGCVSIQYQTVVYWLDRAS